MELVHIPTDDKEILKKPDYGLKANRWLFRLAICVFLALQIISAGAFLTLTLLLCDPVNYWFKKVREAKKFFDKKF